MPVYIHNISTAVPESFESQQSLREIMKEGVSDNRKAKAIIHQIFIQSEIEKRHIANYDYRKDKPDAFFKRAFIKESLPTTKERNEIYKRESTKLFVEVATKLLAQNPKVDKHSITHIITVSCTGFFAPGPDFELVRELGLSPATQRFHIGFMGCYAIFPALKMAKSFCEADPNATILVISCELCTLHLQAKTDIDDLLAASVFADGASGAIISSKKPTPRGFELTQFSSALAYEGEKDMAWNIGNFGFNIVLSSYVPDIIRANIEEILAPLFASLNITKDDIAAWAVHPGGRAIVDKVEQAMELDKTQVASSRKVLSQYGNMSSATILFVLKEILDSNQEDGNKVLPIAFGPGLTVETGLLTSVNP